MNPIHWIYLVPALPLIAGIALAGAIYWAWKFTAGK